MKPSICWLIKENYKYSYNTFPQSYIEKNLTFLLYYVQKSYSILNVIRKYDL